MKEIVFIGDRFYYDSGTVMSNIYEVTPGGFKRYDWGFMQRNLEMGEAHFVRKAANEEMEYFEKKLKKIEKTNGT